MVWVRYKIRTKEEELRWKWFLEFEVLVGYTVGDTSRLRDYRGESYLTNRLFGVFVKVERGKKKKKGVHNNKNKRVRGKFWPGTPTSSLIGIRRGSSK